MSLVFFGFQTSFSCCSPFWLVSQIGIFFFELASFSSLSIMIDYQDQQTNANIQIHKNKLVICLVSYFYFCWLVFARIIWVIINFTHTFLANTLVCYCCCCTTLSIRQFNLVRSMLIFVRPSNLYKKSNFMWTNCAQTLVSYRIIKE